MIFCCFVGRLLSMWWGKPLEISQHVKARATKNFHPEASCKKLEIGAQFVQKTGNL
jgi:hypothetical protein